MAPWGILWLSSPSLLCRLMLGFMGVTAFLSMWISNTATTAMMVPIVEAMLQQMEATSAATEASLGGLELADKGKPGELPGEPWPGGRGGPRGQLCSLPPGALPQTGKHLENAAWVLTLRNVAVA